MTLTQRQMEVISLLDRGKSTQEVADILSISKGTVIMHLMNMYKKLEVHDRVTALHKARELGLLAGKEGK